MKRLVFPQLESSQYRYYEALKQLLPYRCHWLDLGCGHQMFGEWMTAEEDELGSRAATLVGIDLDLDALRRNRILSDRVFGNLASLPFKANSFDVITANMVVEHLENPSSVLQEVFQALRPDGLFVFHTPNARCLLIRIVGRLPQPVKSFLAMVIEGRKKEDIFKTYYRMNSLSSIETLAVSNGFRVQSIQFVSTSAGMVMFGPLVILELLYLRLLEIKLFQLLRSNIVVVLQRVDLSKLQASAVGELGMCVSGG
jgi:SAM-dependent methyltransferase